MPVVNLKYLHSPCVDCFRKLPLSEQLQYAPNWSDTGICSKCGNMYCGNRDCRRVLLRKDFVGYVAVANQDNGDQIMTCDHCRTQHLYFGGRDVHLMGYRLSGEQEWRGV